MTSVFFVNRFEILLTQDLSRGLKRSLKTFRHLGLLLLGQISYWHGRHLGAFCRDNLGPLEPLSKMSGCNGFL